VRRLEVEVGLVLRMPDAVLVERLDLPAGLVRPQDRAAALVDVIPEVDEKAKRSDSSVAPSSGAVRVRPTGLSSRPASKR
jgi:hypothetical protein